MVFLKSRRARILATLCVTAVTVVLLAHPTLAQNAAALGKDPRNKPYFEDGFCYGHHYPKISPDWVNPTITAPEPFEVLVGQPFTVNLTLNNNWLYQTQPSTAYLNISAAPNLRFVAEPHEESITLDGTVLRATAQRLQGGQSRTTFTMPPDVGNATVTVLADTPSAGTPAGPDLDVAVRSPHGPWFYGNESSKEPEVLTIPPEEAVFGGGREWEVVVTYKDGVEPAINYVVEVVVARDPAALRYSALTSDRELSEKHETYTYQWTLVADAPGPALLDFKARIFEFHKHTPADEGHTSDWGNLTRYDTTSVLVLGEPRPPPEPEQRSFLPALGVLAAAAAGAAAALIGRRRDG